MIFHFEFFKKSTILENFTFTILILQNKKFKVEKGEWGGRVPTTSCPRCWTKLRNNAIGTFQTRQLPLPFFFFFLSLSLC